MNHLITICGQKDLTWKGEQQLSQFINIRKEVQKNEIDEFEPMNSTLPVHCSLSVKL